MGAATSNRPLEVSYPLHAYFLRFPFQRRSKSRLIRDATLLANNLVVPHRHDNSSSVIADRRSTKVPTRASCTEMLERSRECPICFHCRCYANDVSAPEDSVANNATWYLKPGSPFICPRKPPPHVAKPWLAPQIRHSPARYLACNLQRMHAHNKLLYAQKLCSNVFGHVIGSV